MSASDDEKAPSLQGCSPIGHNRLPGHQAGGWPPRECPECRKLFEPDRANQLFCCSEHNTAWANRATVRGRVLTPFSMVARITRDGTRGTPEEREIGKRAARKARELIQKHRDEDKAAGRMPWARYMILRVELGLYEELR